MKLTNKRRHDPTIHSTDQLESRVLLTYVRVAVRGDDVQIRGTNDSDSLAVYREGDNLVFEAFDDTYFRGEEQLLEFELPSRIDDVKIDLRNGDDTLIVVADGLHIGDDLRARAGNGDDTLAMIGGSVGDDAQFKLGNGNNILALYDVEIGDDLSVNGGRHNDLVVLKDAVIQDDLTLKTKNGDDTLIGQNVYVGDDFKASMGSGDDLGLVYGGSVGDRAQVNGGRGYDAFGVSEFDFDRNPRVRRFEQVAGFEEVADSFSDEFESIIENLDSVFVPASVEDTVDDLINSVADLLGVSGSNGEELD